MYGIFTYMWLICSKCRQIYHIHGWYGIDLRHILAHNPHVFLPPRGPGSTTGLDLPDAFVDRMSSRIRHGDLVGILVRKNREQKGTPGFPSLPNTCWGLGFWVGFLGSNSSSKWWFNSWPFWDGYISDLQRSGIKRSRIESSAPRVFWGGNDG